MKNELFVNKLPFKPTRSKLKEKALVVWMLLTLSEFVSRQKTKMEDTTDIILSSN